MSNINTEDTSSVHIEQNYATERVYTFKRKKREVFLDRVEQDIAGITPGAAHPVDFLYKPLIVFAPVATTDLICDLLDKLYGYLKIATTPSKTTFIYLIEPYLSLQYMLAHSEDVFLEAIKQLDFIKAPYVLDNFAVWLINGRHKLRAHKNLGYQALRSIKSLQMQSWPQYLASLLGVHLAYLYKISQGKARFLAISAGSKFSASLKEWLAQVLACSFWTRYKNYTAAEEFLWFNGAHFVTNVDTVDVKLERNPGPIGVKMSEKIWHICNATNAAGESQQDLNLAWNVRTGPVVLVVLTNLPITASYIDSFTLHRSIITALKDKSAHGLEYPDFFLEEYRQITSLDIASQIAHDLGLEFLELFYSNLTEWYDTMYNVGFFAGIYGVKTVISTKAKS